jgi:hypothetical protein
MRISRTAIIVVLSCVSAISGNDRGTAQSIYFGGDNIALRNGESTELAQIYYIGMNCQSLLKATPSVEILDGPPGVTAAINEAEVVPLDVGCSTAVPGGKLVISAKDIEDYSVTRMVLRILLKTELGDRMYSRDVNITLFP